MADLLLMEIFEVNANSRYCAETGITDRHDHIAAFGKVKKRVQILTALEDKPFIFVLNLQIPGDPPVSIVSYYALPSNYMELYKDYENMDGFKR
jgi:hypothetical protein